MSFNYFIRQDSLFPFCWHHHNEYELTAVYEGKGSRFVGDSIGSYDGSDLVLIGPNLPHTWQSKEADMPNANKASVIQFDRHFLGEAVWNNPEFQIIKMLLNKSNTGICFHGEARNEIIGKMIAMNGQQNFYKLMSLLDILEKLGHWENTEILSLKVFEKNIDLEQAGRIDKVLQYLSQNYSQEISLVEAAEIVHMSVSSFSRFFKRLTGKNFVNYLNELRVSSACTLLIETDMNISEICFRSGFQSVANFNRRFRQIKKVSPKEFRGHFFKTDSEFHQPILLLHPDFR